MAEPQDLEKVSLAIGGDSFAFTALCKKYSPQILYLCRGLMGNEQDGQDAAQEVFIKMQRSIVQLRSPEAFFVWLHKIVISVCTDMLRKQSNCPQPAPLDEYADQQFSGSKGNIPDAYVDEGEENRELLIGIKKLTYKQRVSILLYYYEGMTYSEIAQVLDSSIRSVEGYLHRARITLKKQISGSLQE